MKNLRLVTIFSLCLFLKVSQLFAEDAPATAPTSSEPKQTVKITEAPVVTTANGVRVETKTIETQTLPPEKSTPTPTNRHFEGSSETKIENNITIDGRGPAFGTLPVTAAPAIVSAISSEAVSSSRAMSIAPVAGVTAYQGAWYNHIANRGTVGLIVDIPLLSMLSLEAEAQYGKFNMSYSNYGKNFSQYSGGANAKLTLGNGLFQPYLGAGMMAVYYEGLSTGMENYGGYSNNSNRVMGAGQLLAGVDLNLLGGIAIGARGELLHPMTNLAPMNGNSGGADASAMNSDFYRILGTVKVNF